MISYTRGHGSERRSVRVQNRSIVAGDRGVGRVWKSFGSPRVSARTRTRRHAHARTLAHAQYTRPAVRRYVTRAATWSQRRNTRRRGLGAIWTRSSSRPAAPRARYDVETPRGRENSPKCVCTAARASGTHGAFDGCCTAVRPTTRDVDAPELSG